MPLEVGHAPLLENVEQPFGMRERLPERQPAEAVERDRFLVAVQLGQGAQLEHGDRPQFFRGGPALAEQGFAQRQGGGELAEPEGGLGQLEQGRAVGEKSPAATPSAWRAKAARPGTAAAAWIWAGASGWQRPCEIQAGPSRSTSCLSPARAAASRQ